MLFKGSVLTTVQTQTSAHISVQILSQACIRYINELIHLFICYRMQWSFHKHDFI